MQRLARMGLCPPRRFNTRILYKLYEIHTRLRLRPENVDAGDRRVRYLGSATFTILEPGAPIPPGSVIVRDTGYARAKSLQSQTP